jgi:hypothetical protein
VRSGLEDVPSPGTTRHRGSKERGMAQAATDESGSNILTKLDERVPSAFYWQLTLLATLGGFLFG